MREVFQSNKYIILSYGFFLGWLLSFPYNGPVLELLYVKYGLSTPALALIFTVVPAVFLIAFSALVRRESFCRHVMAASCVVCMAGTLLTSVLKAEILYFPFAVMGICCVLFIPAWSYFYTCCTSDGLKRKVMALVIITGNVIYYVMNLLTLYLSFSVLCMILVIILACSLLFSLRIDRHPCLKSPVNVKEKSFPGMLVFSVCIFMFVINLNAGIMFQTVYPYFRQYERVSDFYTMVPYIAMLFSCFYLSNRISKTFPLYLGTVLLGVSYLSFSAFGAAYHSFFIVETFAQAGWALIDLFLWTMLGEIAAYYGSPLKISGYGLMSNLLSVFMGGVVGLRLFRAYAEPHFLTGLLAVFIVLVTVLLLPFLAQNIKRFTAETEQMTHMNDRMAPPSETSMLVSLPGFELLTAREAEIAVLLSDGMKNREIAEQLSISENTLKIHARRIYNKLGVSDKKELLQRMIRQSIGNP
jgi:DNA-binding CsgD family transcriptional regulator